MLMYKLERETQWDKSIKYAKGRRGGRGVLYYVGQGSGTALEENVYMHVGAACEKLTGPDRHWRERSTYGTYH